MKRYKHKITGKVFIETDFYNPEAPSEKYYKLDSVARSFYLDKEFIVNSNDWEEVLVENTFSRDVFNQPKEEPNYLITAFKCVDLENQSFVRLCKDGNYFDNVVRNIGLHTLEDMLHKSPSVDSGAFIIYSVKNYKGEEFTIGDTICGDGSKLKIDSFELGEHIYGGCHACEGNHKLSIKVARKIKSPIYTTTDGVEIFEGDNKVLFNLSKETLSKYPVSVVYKFSKEDKKVADRLLCFTSEENRDKYIKENSKKPIFVSADGKDIYEGDKFWIINAFSYEFRDINTTYSGNDNYLKFSTKEAAQEYIDNNKPKYSLQDFRNIVKEMGFLSDSGIYGAIAEQLKKLGK